MKKGMQGLHSVLFEGDDDLANFKVAPGNDQNPTRDRFAEATADMIRMARESWARGDAGSPPHTGVPKARLLQ